MLARILRELNLFLMAFLAMSAVAFLLINGGAFGQLARYALFLRTPFAEADLREGDLLNVRGGFLPSATARGTRAYELIIPKIGVRTPVVIPKSENKAAILASLEEGVGLYPGSGAPGSAGRAVFLGHSSRASWYRGGYATIFALLSKLEPGDEFVVRGEDESYRYRVFATSVRTPADTNALLTGSANGTEIDLITCYPIGSASRRTIVQAALITASD